MRQGFIPVLIIFIILAALPALSQEATEVLTVTTSPSMLVEVTPELTAELSPTASSTLTPSAIPTAIPLEVTAEITESLAESTAEVTENPTESTAEATEALAESTAEVTEQSNPSPEATDMLEVTAEVTEVLAESTATATPMLDIPLMVLRGEVQFQNRADDAGILIRVFTLEGQLVSESASNERGVFSLAAPAEMPFVLLIEAPLHRAIRLELLPNDSIPSVILAGGDIDNDGCINDADMQALLLNYGFADTPTTDINADGRTDLADLAILTGNFSRDCGLLVESTESPELE